VSIEFRIPVTQEILNTVSKLDRFRGEWPTLTTLPAERLERLRQASVIQSIASSCRLSGMHLNENEVAAAINGDESVADAKAILGYAAGIDFPFPGADRIVDCETLSGLNATILHRDPVDPERIPWREQEMNREAFDGDGKALGWVFPTLPPRLVEEKTEDLLTWLELELRADDQHPVLIIGTFVLAFLAISPFERGNGRTSRMLIRHLLVRSGYEPMTLASVESELESDRPAYLDALFHARTGLWSGNADLQSWVEFFLAALDRQRERIEAKLSLERGALDFPPLQRQILETVREHGSVNAALLLESTGANRNTLKDNLRRLVDRGVLERTGQKRGTRYRLSAGNGQPVHN
jgi:Fic family protein